MENEQSVFFLSPHTPFGRVRLARFVRVRLLRHPLPISLLILRKKTDCFAVYVIFNPLYNVIIPITIGLGEELELRRKLINISLHLIKSIKKKLYKRVKVASRG